jgi:hypothetical protein
MKIEYEYIRFEKDETFSGKKTYYYYCVNKKSGNDLGFIKWYPQWRQYCFFVNSLNIFNSKIFSVVCLKDITHFIEQLMAEREEILESDS